MLTKQDGVNVGTTFDIQHTSSSADVDAVCASSTVNGVVPPAALMVSLPAPPNTSASVADEGVVSVVEVEV